MNTLSVLHRGAEQSGSPGGSCGADVDGSGERDENGSGDGEGFRTGGRFRDGNADGSFTRGGDERLDCGPGAGRSGTLAPPNRAVNLVNSHGVCATVLHTPDVVLWLGSAHGRSRFTDQNVNRSRRWLRA